MALILNTFFSKTIPKIPERTQKNITMEGASAGSKLLKQGVLGFLGEIHTEIQLRIEPERVALNAHDYSGPTEKANPYGSNPQHWEEDNTAAQPLKYWRSVVLLSG